MGYSEGVVFEFDEARWASGPADFDAAAVGRLKRLGDVIIRWMRDNGPSDTSAALESLVASVNPLGDGSYELVVESTDPAAAAKLQTGRGPGGFPPQERIQGWLTRRTLGSHAIGRVRAVGKKVGYSYHRRRTPKNPVGRVSAAMAEVVSVVPGSAIAGDVYMVSRKIAQRGTPAPRLFTRAFEATAAEQERTIAAITRELTRRLNREG